MLLTKFQITREEQDKFAVCRTEALRAQKENKFKDEIVILK